MRNMPKAIRYNMMKRDEQNREYNNYPRNETEIEINARDPMQYNYESRFRDRTGREHYDNGRFAPMRSEYRGDNQMRDRNDGGGTRDRERYYPEMMYPGQMPESSYGDDREPMRRVIGFAAPSMHYTGPSTADEMQYRTSHAARGYSHGDGVPPLTKETAQRWAQKMRNEDGSEGEHWTMEQTSTILNQRGYKHNPVEWYAIMNAMFSDYYNVAKKYGVAGNAEFYADLANAWLDDKDSVKDKAAMYYAKIVRH